MAREARPGRNYDPVACTHETNARSKINCATTCTAVSACVTFYYRDSIGEKDAHPRYYFLKVKI